MHKRTRTDDACNLVCVDKLVWHAYVPLEKLGGRTMLLMLFPMLPHVNGSKSYWRV